jgi:hypothetical protein
MMELDDIKNAWTTMDERLKKNEGLNERLIKEMLRQKSSKALKSLYNYQVFGIITTFLTLPLLIHFYLLTRLSPIHQFIIYGALGICFTSAISQIYSLILISKINLQKEIKENTKWVQRYRIYIKRATAISTVVVSLFLLGCIVGLLLLQYMEVWRWAIVIVMIFGVYPLLLVWQYKKYKNNIQSIMESLEELEDLSVEGA